MRHIAPIYEKTAWHTRTLIPSPAPRASEPSAEPPSPTCGHGADSLAPVTEAPHPISPKARRDPAAGAAFCDAFNAGLGLSREALNQKIDLMCSTPLKLARCMPALFMSDVLGAYAELGALSERKAPVVQIDGDCHFGNFGVVRGPEAHAVWGLNDHDMTCKGSPAFDLDRLAFSLVSAMRQQGISSEKTSKVVARLASAYQTELSSVADGSTPALPFLKARETDDALRKLIEKADEVSRNDQIKKLAEPDGHGGWRFLRSDSVTPVPTREATIVTQALHRYDETQGETPAVARPLRIFDVARKLDSGGSSFGQPRYWAMVANADGSMPPVVLEVKQELPAPLVGWNGDPEAARRASRPNWTGNLHKADASQVVKGQRAMGGNLNPLTGTTDIDGLSYLVREREPCKASLSDRDLGSTDDFVMVAQAAGKVLARAHARDAGSAKALLVWAGDEACFAERLDAFAQAYATQAEHDLAAYRQAHPQSGSAA